MRQPDLDTPTLKLQLLAVALALFVLLQCAAMAVTTRLGEPPDEWAHLSYVQDVAGGRLIPDYADGRINNSERSNYLTHPPLYYSLLGIYTRIAQFDPVQDYRQLRLVSAAFVGIGVLLWLLIARHAGIGALGMALGTLSACATPMFSYAAGSINNDSLLYLGIGLFFFGISRAYLTPRDDAIAVAAVLSGLVVTFLTKATGSAFLVFFMLASLTLDWRQSLSFLKSRRTLGVVGMVGIVCGGYFLYALLHFGAFLPAPAPLYAEARPAQPLVPIEYVVRYAVIMWERLPIIMSHASIQPFVTPKGTAAFQGMLLLPVLSWMLSRPGARARGVPESLLRGTDAFVIAGAATIIMHIIVAYRGYLSTGLMAGLQPRYFAFLLPALWLLPFAVERRRMAVLLLGGALAVCASIAFWTSVPFVVAEQRAHAPQRPHRPSRPSASASMVGHLDELALSDGQLKLRGWVFDTSRSRQVRSIIASAGGQTLATIGTGHARPDVARSLRNPDAASAGFDAKIDGIGGDIKECQIRIVGEDQDGASILLRTPTCK